MNGGGYERILSKQKAKDEALAWFVRVNSGDAGDAELRAHRRWLAASDDNRAEYERISGIWSDFDKVADPRLPLTMRKPPLGRRPGRRAFLAGGLATAAGLAAVTAINGLPAGFLADYSTGTGEQRSLTLADGSTVNLDADTALVVKFNDRERRLLLLSGRAFFAVAKDAHRPFVVEAASCTAPGSRCTNGVGMPPWRWRKARFQ
ncbi:FecR family protein [Pseudomonas helleri]|uniref:FecR family protein n=1 Tax=Pseudomonas helleri TaxID=1608996 RepID=UPI003FD03C6E